MDKETFIAISKNNRTLESKDIKTVYSAKEEGIKIYLFLRKDTKGNEVVLDGFDLHLPNVDLIFFHVLIDHICIYFG